MEHNGPGSRVYESGREFPSATEAFEQAGRKCKSLYPKVCQSAIKSCLASISRAVKSGMTSTVADVPVFAFGEPLSHVDDVTEHVKTILELRGYSVITYEGSQAVAICWGPVRTSKRRKCTATSPVDTAGTSFATVESTMAKPNGQFDVGL